MIVAPLLALAALGLLGTARLEAQDSIDELGIRAARHPLLPPLASGAAWPNSREELRVLLRPAFSDTETLLRFERSREVVRASIYVFWYLSPLPGAKGMPSTGAAVAAWQQAHSCTAIHRSSSIESCVVVVPDSLARAWWARVVVDQLFPDPADTTGPLSVTLDGDQVDVAYRRGHRLRRVSPDPRRQDEGYHARAGALVRVAIAQLGWSSRRRAPSR